MVEIKGRTLPECFFNRARREPQREFLFQKVSGQWKATNYQTALDFCLQTVAGLKALQFQSGDKISILAENRMEWILTDYAAHWLGGATAAIYTTTTPDQMAYILNESEAKVMFVSNATLLARLAECRNLTHLKTIVLWDAISNPRGPEGVKVLTREEFLKPAIAMAEAEALLAQVSPGTLAILLYTSGTTGEPKGVMLTHENLVSNIKVILKAIPQVTQDKITLSFLPLSHIYERIIHNAMVLAGLRIHFAESLDKLLETIKEVRPQIMTAVPRIFEKMYAKIMEKIKNAPGFRRTIFFAALKIGKKAFGYRYRKEPMPAWLSAAYQVADRLVFKEIRAVTGGRAELFVSGGAPLSKEIAEFFFQSGFTILEGYGLSETCILSVNRVDRFRFGTVGHPFDDITLKIAEDGEIIVKAPSVMKGYFKKPEATAEVIDGEGWFHTGDIGEQDPDGFFRITDRKKDLIVTAGGKKIAPQPIENALKKDPLLEMACLVGDQMKYVVALVVPNLEMVQGWARHKGISLKSLDDCAVNDELRRHYQKIFDQVNATLPKFSTIKDFKILSRPFSQESGELTPTLKLKRRVVQKHFAAEIASLYPDEDQRVA